MSWTDFNDDKKEREVVAIGTYEASLFDAKLDETGEYPKISMAYKLKNESGDLVWQNFNFNEKGQKWIKRQFSALGLSEDVKSNVKGDTPEAAARGYLDATNALLVKNAPVIKIEVSHREWEGKTYANTKVLGTVEKDVAGFDEEDKIPF